MKRHTGLPFLILSITLCLAAVLVAFLSPSLNAPGRPTPTPPATQTGTASPSPTVTLTATLTPSVTPTRTPRPTFTRTASPTPTATQTGTATATPTSTPTPPPAAPAELPAARDRNGRVIDWGYQRVTALRSDEQNNPVSLSAFFAVRLMDRGIHRQTVQLPGGRSLTQYYLNGVHQFGAQTEAVRVILSGEWGEDVPLQDIATAGSYLVTARVLEPGDTFDPYIVHWDTRLAFAARPPEYAPVFLADLQQTLADLPSAVVLLVEHSILVEPAAYPDLNAYFQNAPYLAARYAPLVTLGTEGLEQGRVSGPSPLAQALAGAVLEGSPVPGGPLDLPAEVLIFLPGAGE